MPQTLEHEFSFGKEIKGEPTLKIIGKFHNTYEYNALVRDANIIYDLYKKKYSAEIEVNGYNSKVKGIRISIEAAKDEEDGTNPDEVKAALTELGLFEEWNKIIKDRELNKQTKKNKANEGRRSNIKGVGFIKYRSLEEQNEFSKTENRYSYHFKHEGDIGVKDRLHGWYRDFFDFDESMIIFRREIKKWKRMYEKDGGGYNSKVYGIEYMLEPYPVDTDEFLKKYPFVEYTKNEINEFVIHDLEKYFESKAASLKMAKGF